ncbi:MAG: ABC transporter substrate-binding protein [Betaproteobacteria bacterium]
MKTPIASLARTSLAGLVALSLIGGAHADEKSVAVTAIVDHPALDAVREGVLAELKAAGFEPGKTLKWQSQSAQGNTSTAAQIARKYVGDHPSVIVPISTPSAQAVVVATRDIPIVYAAVGDPVAAGLVKSWKASGTNVTGVSDMVPVDEQLDVIKLAAPNVKRIGIVYNPGEANSVALVSVLKAKFPAAGYTLIEAAAPRSVDVATAAKSLVGKVDLIYAPTDNTVSSAFPAIAKVASDSKLPLFAGDNAMVKQGAAIGLGVNYLNLGHQAGQIVVRILKGEAPGTIESQTSPNLELYVNADAAKAQGLTLPESLLKRARFAGK